MNTSLSSVEFNKKPIILALSLAMLTLSVQADSASERHTNKVKKGDTSFQIGEYIEVVGKGLTDASRVLTSVDRMSADVAQSSEADYAWKLLGRLPGVMLTEFNQGSSSGKLSFRGFNGEGEVNAVKLLIDGIPSNSNDGNMPYMDMIFPLEIEVAEVVRGTTDPALVCTILQVTSVSSPAVAEITSTAVYLPAPLVRLRLSLQQV